MNALGVIPARLGATRFPEKVLAQIAGKPMIQHVFENAKRAGIFDKLCVATDDPKGVIAAEVSDEYAIREGIFQHIVLEGTSYEVGRMQREIIKETANAKADII